MASLPAVRPNFDPSKMRKQLVSTLKTKADFVNKNIAKHTKKMREGGFHPFGVLVWARKNPNAKSAKAPVELLLWITCYTKEDFATWHLSSDYYRWSDTLNCLELAKKRSFLRLEKPDPALGEAAYYPPLDQLEWVPLPSGAFINVSDFSETIDKEREWSLVRVNDLAPKIRSDEQLKAYPGGSNWTWVKHSVQLIHQFPRAIPTLLFELPPPAFHLAPPTRIENDLVQRWVFLNVPDFFDDAAVEAKFQLGAFTVSQLAPPSKIDHLAYELKTVAKEQAPFIKPPDEGNAQQKPKRRNSKCLLLSGAAEQKRLDSDRVQSISLSVKVWEDVIERCLPIRDLFKWVDFGKFLVPILGETVMLATVSKDRTAQSDWNANVGGGAATDGEPIILGGGDDDGGVDWDADIPAAAAASSDPVVEPQNEAPPAVVPNAAPDADEFAAAAAYEQATSTNEAGQPQSNAKEENFSFFLDVTVQNLFLDVYGLFQKFLVPVTPAWVMEMRPVLDDKKQPVINPQTKKPQVVVKNPCLAKSSGTYPPLDLSRLLELPEVINVSEVSKEQVPKFCEFVRDKKGEFRVFVNTSTYTNDAFSKQFVQAIRTLTPEEGSKLLDTGIPGRNIEYIKPETFNYILFFLNYAAHGKVEVPRKEAAKEALGYIKKYIRPDKLFEAPSVHTTVATTTVPPAAEPTAVGFADLPTQPPPAEATQAPPPEQPEPPAAPASDPMGVVAGTDTEAPAVTVSAVSQKIKSRLKKRGVRADEEAAGGSDSDGASKGSKRRH